MHVFLVAVAAVAIAEMGDRTQLLSLVLAARFRKRWTVLAAIFVATVLSQTMAGMVGVAFARYLTPVILNSAVGISMLAMAGWTLLPDKSPEGVQSGKHSAFVTTLVAFFIAELGDKTQIATVALAAGYDNLFAVCAGSTVGMMLANIPVVFLGDRFSTRLPMRVIRFCAAGLFAAIGLWFLVRAMTV